MSLEACPQPSPDCPYWNHPSKIRGQESGCYSDSDHIIPRFMGTTALERMYIGRAENRQQLCRWEHDIKTVEERINPPELPPIDEMQAAVRRSRAQK